MSDRLTVRNPNGSYRAPMERQKEFRWDHNKHSTALFGDLVDKLGVYEDLLSLEEAKAYAKKKTK